MDVEARQTALEDATELARREGTFRGRDSMREYLAERGYPDEVIEEALRVAAEERREAAFEHERRRNAMAERSSRVRVVVAPAVAMVLGYVLMMLAASSFGYMFVAFACSSHPSPCSCCPRHDLSRVPQRWHSPPLRWHR